ncbi:cytochrome D1 domain-containing protein [Paraburkholderia phymatum]|uniref:40-residue YVTN family beta-propeller repeat protein n=1 Tax=Paraburkholderia phymatum (strain DSM 17167 / CIP 108236 / LMG 21445 / STM815) TaxID=391038 RepID=B2JX66_PARP8|nr:cytochrome D1 domain-containing protein [Paraburkholderia phymatum]ACC75543.1 40-residue YVTN family beta-propeller repeat protein [Paraburkholderia phymatum STM815]
MHCTIGHTRRLARVAATVALAVLLGACAGQATAAAVAYVTSETNGVGVIDLDQMTLTRTIGLGKDGPRGLSLTADGHRLLVANKTGDLSVIDTSTDKVVARVRIGKNPEFVRVHHGFAYVTYEPGESGPPPQAANQGAKQGAGKPESMTGGKPETEAADAKGGKGGHDDDANSPPAEVAIVDLKTMKVVRSVKSGHETEGVEFSPDGRELLVTNEGDDTVSVYRTGTGKPVRTAKLDRGSRPRGIKASPDGKQYVVTLENTNKFVVLDAGTLEPVKTVDTKMGPYGVAFDPSGKHLLVAAARDKTLQVFDAKTYEHVADAPVGQRCWHFSFTPDGSKVLMACGRSNAVFVLDANNRYQTVSQIGDLPLAWGIVTSPPSQGSIESR